MRVWEIVKGVGGSNSVLSACHVCFFTKKPAFFNTRRSVLEILQIRDQISLYLWIQRSAELGSRSCHCDYSEMFISMEQRYYYCQERAKHEQCRHCDKTLSCNVCCERGDARALGYDRRQSGRGCMLGSSSEDEPVNLRRQGIPRTESPHLVDEWSGVEVAPRLSRKLEINRSKEDLVPGWNCDRSQTCYYWVCTTGWRDCEWLQYFKISLYSGMWPNH